LDVLGSRNDLSSLIVFYIVIEHKTSKLRNLRIKRVLSFRLIDNIYHISINLFKYAMYKHVFPKNSYFLLMFNIFLYRTTKRVLVSLSVPHKALTKEPNNKEKQKQDGSGHTKKKYKDKTGITS